MNINIPLNDLVLSPLNTRTTPPGASEQAELAASIMAHGLLENLIVRPAGHDRYEVLAGQRRLLVMQDLARDGELAVDYPVACLVHEGDPREVSLAENVVRLPMHPLDQFEAFAALADQGLGVTEIAARFGNTEHLVNRRLRLGRVAPELREAYRADEITLETLMAFAVTEDHARQLAVWNEIRDGYVHAVHVRRLLTDGKIAADSRFVRFIGLESYEAAGGTGTRDLFSEGAGATWLDDGDLVMRLVREKLAGAGEALQAAEGWKWVQAAPDLPHGDMRGYQRVYPQAVEPTPEQQAELARLRQALEAYDAIHEDTGLSPEEEEKVTALEEQYEALEDGLRAYAPEDLERAGCVVCVDYDGNLLVRRGLVRPEDRIKASDTDTGTGDGAADGESSASASGYSAKLRADLGTIRLGVARKYLAQDFGCAFDVMVFTMAHAMAGSGFMPGKPLDVSFRAALPHDRAELPGELDTGWLDLPPDEGFGVLAAWPVEDKQRLFARCTALVLQGGLAAGDDLHEAIGRRLGVDMAAHWRPDAETFFTRITKPCALEIAAGVLGEAWARSHKNDRKAVLAEALEANFGGNPTPGVTPERAAAATRWLPDGMAYAVNPDAPGAGGSGAGLRAFWQKARNVATWRRNGSLHEGQEHTLR